jgi:hypothetical protein
MKSFSLSDCWKLRLPRATRRRPRRRAARQPVSAWLPAEVLEARTLLSAASPAVDLGTTSETASGDVIAAFSQEALGVRVVWGEQTVVDGSRIAAWALLAPQDNTILAVGATFSIKIAEEMPLPGDGPAGAFATLDFPALVQQTTFFNHMEIQSQEHGHESPRGAVNPNIFGVPHFDFHFYDMPEEQVRSIPAGPPIPPVAPDLLAPGYLPAGPSIAEMGRHSAPASVLSDPNPLSAIVIAGYVPNGTRMHFLEPMVSTATLLQRQDVSLPVPRPQELGRGSATLYPTRFEAVSQGESYHFVFSEFITVGETGTASAASSTSASQAANVDTGTTTVVSLRGLDVAAERSGSDAAAIAPPNARITPVLALNARASTIGVDLPGRLDETEADDSAGDHLDRHDERALQLLDVVWSDPALLAELW